MIEREERDMMRHEKKSMFLRPNEESARVENTSPPTKQPAKNMEAGRPMMKELEHSSPNSEMMEACVGPSQAHEYLGRVHMLVVAELHGLSMQCHDGCASVKIVMNAC